MKQRLIIVALLASISLAFSQISYRETYDKQFLDTKYPQKIPVLFRTFPLYQGDNQYRVIIPVRVQNSYLQFISEAGTFRAGAELEVEFKNSKSGEATRSIRRSETVVDDFDETLSKTRYLVHVDSLDLPAGSYDIVLKYRDLNGSQELRFVQKLSLPDSPQFHAPLPVWVDSDGMEEHGFPEISNGVPTPLLKHWDFNKDLGIYLKFWSAEASPRMLVTLINSKNGRTVFSDDSTFSIASGYGSAQYLIPANELQEGKHRLKIVYYHGQDSTTRSVPFNITWFDKPISLWDTKLAIGPLEYIVDKEIFDDLRKGKGEEKQAKLNDFWKKLDQTPETPFNELQREFYSRVDSANVLFSSRKVLGWRTDPGKIYIAVGPPDEIIDNSLAPIGEPHLKWIYNRDNKQLVYTFLAIEGRKKYRLLKSEESPL